MLGGLSLVGVAAFLNANHAAASETWSSPVVIAIVALAFGSVMAVPVMMALWQSRRRVLALLALAGLVCGESYGFQLSAERLMAARAQRAQQVQTAGSPWHLAKEALDLSISERKEVCKNNGVRSKSCAASRELEEAKRTALGIIPVPSSHAYIADATGLPEWLVEIVPAMTFSTGLLVLGFVLVGFAAHGGGSKEHQEVAAAVLEPVSDERERVVSWVRAYRQRHGRSPKIPEVQKAFNGLPRTTAWRRIEQSR
jgi:hypothetical protein